MTSLCIDNEIFDHDDEEPSTFDEDDDVVVDGPAKLDAVRSSSIGCTEEESLRR